MNKPSDHAADCGWHLDQYPHECDCGVIAGKLGNVTIDRQLFEAMIATLQRKGNVFDHYANLHADKASEEGDRKALANRTHGTDIKKVLDRIGPMHKAGRPTMHLDTLDALYEMCAEAGGTPVAFVMTTEFRQAAIRDYCEMERKRQPITSTTPETVRGPLTHYRGCELLIAPEGHWHSAVVCCSEGSPVLQKARATRESYVG